MKKFKLLDAENKRKKFAITIGDELPSGILQVIAVVVWLMDVAFKAVMSSIYPN